MEFSNFKDLIKLMTEKHTCTMDFNGDHQGDSETEVSVEKPEDASKVEEEKETPGGPEDVSDPPLAEAGPQETTPFEKDTQKESFITINSEIVVNSVAKSQNLDIFELASHLASTDCTRNRTCLECKVNFSTHEEFHAHL